MKKAITFLGKDSGFGKFNTSAYAKIQDRLLLIDCGYTVMTQLKEKNLLEDISGIDVVITHMHGDHIGSLSQLALYSYFVLKIPINVISACIHIDDYLTITGVNRFDTVFGYPLERYTRNNNFVMFIPTLHVNHEMDCYGFSAKINGIPIVYTGDTIILDPFLEYLTPGTQFYVDASISGGCHLKLEDNIAFLDGLKKKGIDVYLMHLDEEEKIRERIKGTTIQICDE